MLNFEPNSRAGTSDSHDIVAEFAGALGGTYRPEELDDLRDEWR